MLKTEMRNPATMHIDEMSTIDKLRAMNAENYNAVRAVEAVLPSIASAVDRITEAFQSGGRLFYLGAGTSGRLGVLDASECPPTYGVEEGMIVGLIAGGDEALRRAGEKEEDDPEASVRELKSCHLNSKDVVVGISAAGGAAYVVGGVTYAGSIGCCTVGLTCNAGSPLDKAAEISIITDTGAEVVTGSTRLKAGTAHKLVLNMLTTASMIACGNICENLMINLQPSNAKLKKRMIGIVQDLAHCNAAEAEKLLENNGWNIRKACGRE